jgi:hypothetical protein
MAGLVPAISFVGHGVSISGITGTTLAAYGGSPGDDESI